MQLHIIPEPVLEFGNDTHVCPRMGITLHEVYDTRFHIRRDQILVGAVGTGDDLSRLAVWLDQCAKEIPPKEDSEQPNLHPAFCGFNKWSGFKAQLILNDEITRKINNSDIKRILQIKRWNERVEAAVDMYYDQAKFLAQNRPVDLIVCVIPTALLEQITKEESKPTEDAIEEEEPDDIVETNFRRALKARAMHLAKPLQLVMESSLESNAKSRQDDATKAWNFCTALYYKASQTVPWRMVTNINRPAVCYVGIGFYRSRDKKVLHTSLAQVFNELGNSVILRGTPVDIDKDDRRPHLKSDQASLLLIRALEEYEDAVGTSPGRLVLHKSSKYDDAEMDGFKQAAQQMRVGRLDFVTILDTKAKLLRNGIYPPYRGMCAELDQSTQLLYTRGAVEYYKTYPGKYVPQPIEIRIIEADESPLAVCTEILGLTKMNWNNTQFDGKYPITLKCARMVGEIMKYLGDDKPQSKYCYYM